MADVPILESDEVVIADGAVGTNRLGVNADSSITVTQGAAGTSIWPVEPKASTIVAYSASVSGLVPAASATDVFTITGSATKIVKITRIEVSGTTSSGSGIGVNVQIIKRSTANSAGTSSAATSVPMDSNDAAGTATVRSYTANPTLGTAVGTIISSRMSFVTTGQNSDNREWSFGNRAAKPIVVRGTSQVVAVNLNVATITGPVMGATIEWTEE